MKNIGIIINTLRGGGAERCAADLSNILARRGYNIYLVTDASSGITYEYSGRVIEFKISFDTDALGNNALEQKVGELIDIKQKYKFDISISFMQICNYLNLLSRTEDRIIVTTHCINSEYARFSKGMHWKKETFERLYQYADVITFPSEYCRQDWIKYYGDKNNITRTVYNPVHVMHIEEKGEQTEKVIISVGRMHAIKRQWILLRVFSLVRKECPNSKLILLGDGECRSKLEKMVLELGLEQAVEMPGNVSDVQAYLARASVFTITSRFESLSCATLEALSAGVPVVAFDIPGGIREALGMEQTTKEIQKPFIGECGIVTPYLGEYMEDAISKEEQVLANELVHVLKDNNLRTSLGENAPLQVRKFTPGAIGDIWVNEIFKVDISNSINWEEYNELKKYHLAEFVKGVVLKEYMYRTYYQIQEKWLKLRESGKSIHRYFYVHRMNRIIIYGFGAFANHILFDLHDSNINIVCIIDKAAVNKCSDYHIITGNGIIPEADCIVVTPICEFGKIKEELQKKTKVPIISLAEIINYFR